VYDVSSGVLLSRNLHHRYDRLEWSFYYSVSGPRWKACTSLTASNAGRGLLRSLLCDFEAFRIPWQGHTFQRFSRQVPVSATESEIVRMALRAVCPGTHSGISCIKFMTVQRPRHRVKVSIAWHTADQAWKCYVVYPAGVLRRTSARSSTEISKSLSPSRKLALHLKKRSGVRTCIPGYSLPAEWRNM
jgi:hypothetical protein